MSSVILSSFGLRPVARFHSSHWVDHLLNIKPHDQATLSRIEQQTKEVREEVEKGFSTCKKMEDQVSFIDALERLGVAYHFEDKIDALVLEIYSNYNKSHDQDHDLHHTSTQFRILRQHGFPVSCDVFNKFKDEDGKFKETLKKDVVGVLSLYEACHVRTHGDDILDEALKFTTACLKDTANNSDSPFKEQVAHALHQPLHKGMPRLEARHYISVYEKHPTHNKSFLKFAKLDFNYLQSLHRNELHEFSRWWKDLHLKVSYSRDRLAEVYFWILETYFEPKYASARNILRKICKATQVLDDTYDAYGTTEELQLLTQAIQRWDKDDVDKLPEHVKWSYQAIREAFDEAEEELAKQGRSFAIGYAIEQMKVLCEAYLQEVKWRDEKQIPTYEEYMKVALVTSPYPFGVVSCFLGMETATKEAFEWACHNPMPDAITAAATIIRLLNDLYGHKFEQSRGHVASVVQCYMERHGVSKEEQVEEELLKKVDEAWKEVNQAMLQPYVISKPLLTRILNLARSASVIYNGEDGYTIVSESMKKNVADVLFNPIPM